jgi:glycosyltransferase involved in cell wall biosynthesis
MTPRPRLLFLAYYFPPAAAIGGVRSHNVAKWLTRSGWDVTVVTPSAAAWRSPRNAEAIEAELGREGIRCMRTQHRWSILSPGHLLSPEGGAWPLFGRVARRSARLAGIEMEAGWRQDAERACRTLRPEDVDLILATGTPFGSFALADRLAQKLECPFVMDYRDLWTANPHVSAKPRPGALRLERELLGRCAAAIGVSPGVAESLRSRMTRPDRVHIVTNGYDPEEMSRVDPHSYDHFAIVYAGVFYPPKRVITPVMAALKKLSESGARNLPNWSFHYFGWNSAHVREAAARYGLEARVVLHGMRPRHEVLSAIKGADVSVVVASVEKTAKREDRGIVTGKVFDAIGLGTPMLVIAPTGSDLEDVVRTAGLGQCFTGDDIDGVAGYLRSAMERRLPTKAQPETYSWPNMVGRLDSILRQSIGIAAPVRRAAGGEASR